MMRCGAELCPNWTGEGCTCQALGIDPPSARHDDRCACDECQPWEYGYEGHGYWGKE